MADPRVLRSGPDALRPEMPIRSTLMAPLMVGGRASRDAHRLSPWEERLHRRRSAQCRVVHPLVAQAVVNARLYAEAENARVWSEMLLEDMATRSSRLDRNSTLVGWNKGAERLFGYTAEEVLGTYSAPRAAR